MTFLHAAEDRGLGALFFAVAHPARVRDALAIPHGMQLIGAVAVAVMQIYALNGYDFPFLAWLWDIIAKTTGRIANLLGFISIQARLNYYTVINSYGN